MNNENAAAPSPSLGYLFTACFKIGLLSFGGGLTGWLYNEFVMRTGLISDDDFASSLAVSQMLPGANVINLVICIGNELRGLNGAVVCCLAFILGPFFAVIAMCYAYAGLSRHWFFSPFCDGVAFAAVGLLGATCFRGIQRAKGSLPALSVLGATALLTGAIQLPLIPVVAVMAPVSVFLAWRGRQHAGQ